ncbi:hypothetical protein HOY82DRAFT_543005 [Tuber indicum]|nr:hypothetical protein HOY82DRAFT_543004 [Tuber indicum]KAG0125715.1 hypothetical protein HOY82DRAFT_543005 [Tuber indicum]
MELIPTLSTGALAALYSPTLSDMIPALLNSHSPIAPVPVYGQRYIVEAAILRWIPAFYYMTVIFVDPSHNLGVGRRRLLSKSKRKEKKPTFFLLAGKALLYTEISQNAQISRAMQDIGAYHHYRGHQPFGHRL